MMLKNRQIPNLLMVRSQRKRIGNGLLRRSGLFLHAQSAAVEHDTGLEYGAGVESAGEQKPMPRTFVAEEVVEEEEECREPDLTSVGASSCEEWSLVHPRPFVVGLLGVSGTGKTSLSNHLRDHYGFAKFSLAAPIKESCRTLFGFDMEDMTDPERKNLPSRVAHSELTPRQAMQYMTAALSRVDQGDLLRRNLGRRIREIMRCSSQRVVVSDLRFPGDVEYLRSEFGATIFGLTRDKEKRYAPSTGRYESPGIVTHLPWALDPSEACVDLGLADQLLDNNGDDGIAHLAEEIVSYKSMVELALSRDAPTPISGRNSLNVAPDPL